MTGPAQDAYHAYHTHLGTLPAAAPFEELPMREQEAWRVVAGVSADHLEQLESAQQEGQRAEFKIEDLEQKVSDQEEKIRELEIKLSAKTKKETAATTQVQPK